MLAQRISGAARSLAKSSRQQTRNVSTFKFTEPVEPLTEASLKGRVPLNVLPERIPTPQGVLPRASRVEVANVDGFTLVAVDEPTPVTTMSLFVKAGSRFEEGNTLGASSFLKHLAFSNTEKKYFYPLILDADVRGTEYGAVNTREYVGYYTTGLRSEQENMAETLGAAFQPLLEEWQVDAVREQVKLEAESAGVNGKNVLLDAVHREAFRDQGLGHSPLCPPFVIDSLSPQDLRKFVNTYYNQERVVIVGNGLSMGELKSHVDAFLPFNVREYVTQNLGPGLEEFFPNLAAGGAINTTKSIYTGGAEVRLAGAGATQLLVAAEGVSTADLSSQLAAATLANIIGSGVANLRGIYPSFPKQSRLGKEVASNADWLNGAEAFSLSYSDAGLFGIYAQATPGNVGRVSETIAKQFKNLEVVTEAEVARAKAQLANSLVSSLSSDRVAAAEFYTHQVATRGSALTPSQFLEEINKVTAQSVVEVAKKVASSKLTVAALGDIKGLSRF